MDCDLEGPRGPSWRRAPALALSWATKCVRTLSLCPATGEVIPENEPGHQSDPPLARVSRPLPRCPLCRVRTVDPAGGDSLADSFPELWRRQEDPRAKAPARIVRSGHRSRPQVRFLRRTWCWPGRFIAPPNLPIEVEVAGRVRGPEAGGLARESAFGRGATRRSGEFALGIFGRLDDVYSQFTDVIYPARPCGPRRSDRELP
jgi:hypothetical protein